MDKKIEKRFTAAMKCGHCGNTAPMEIVALFSRIEEHYDETAKMTFEAGPAWELLFCPACLDVSLQKIHYHDLWEPEGSTEIIYPTKIKLIIGLPKEVNIAYEAALKVSIIDPNAYAVLLGRVLDKVCIDRKAEGGSLSDKLKFLAEKGEIPSRLAEIAHQLRQLRNIGAHADLGDLTTNEIPVLSSLCNAILEYVYTAPALIEQVKKHLEQLKTNKDRNE